MIGDLAYGWMGVDCCCGIATFDVRFILPSKIRDISTACSWTYLVYLFRKILLSRYTQFILFGSMATMFIHATCSDIS